MHPTVGLSRAFPVAQLRKFPGVFQGVPEIQDFTTARKRPSWTGGNGGSVSPALRRRRVERTCIPKLQPSTPSTTVEGAACVGAPILRLSA
jgi:hypothetical protein